MQLQHARKWSETRSGLLGKWPKCSQFSGKLYACVCVNCIRCFCVFMCVYWVCVTLCMYTLLSRRGHKVLWGFQTCLPVSVFPAERRVKMYWRLRAWRLLACCRAGFSLEADRHCRAVSTRRSISLFSTLYAILFVSFLHRHSQSYHWSCPSLSLILWL